MSPTIDSGLPYKNWALIFPSIIINITFPNECNFKAKVCQESNLVFNNELKGETTITSGNAGMIKPLSSYTLKTLGKIWKVKLLPKPVGRAANTSFLRTTCSPINYELTSAPALDLKRRENTSYFQKSLPWCLYSLKQGQPFSTTTTSY